MGAASVEGSGGGPYSIENSVYFNSSSSGYLYRTPSGTSSPTTFTTSCWVKRASSGSCHKLWSGGDSVDEACEFEFTANDYLQFNQQSSGSARDLITTNATYTDTNWHHFVCAIDSTQSTDSNRVKLYVDGTLITSLSNTNYPGSSETFRWNEGGVANAIGRESYRDQCMLNGYFADYYNIDGSQKAASDFGETNDDGDWVPIEYTGSYGTHGFFLNFQDGSDLGNDVSGNNNDLTKRGTLTQSTDTPTS